MIVQFQQKKKPCIQEIYDPIAKSGGPVPQIGLPVFASPVSAGFPTMAEDFTEGKLDLNTHLVPNPKQSFIVKVSGDSMIGAGIHPEDLLIVDQSTNPEDGHIVVAALNGELTVKRLCQKGSQLFLMPENSGYPGIEVTQEMNFVIWGVVHHVVHKLS